MVPMYLQLYSSSTHFLFVFERHDSNRKNVLILIKFYFEFFTLIKTKGLNYFMNHNPGQVYEAARIYPKTLLKKNEQLKITSRIQERKPETVSQENHEVGSLRDKTLSIKHTI